MINSALTFDRLRTQNVPRSLIAFNHALEDWSECEWGCAVGGEVGELLNKLKKRLRKDDPNASQSTLKDVADEMADVIIYLDLLAAKMNVDLGQAVINKFNQTSDKRGCTIKL